MRGAKVFIYLCGLLFLPLASHCDDPIAQQVDTTPMDYKNKPETYWKKVLSPEVYNICRQRGTERAFSGQYDKFYKPGIYTCACCGGDYPLFSSQTKFDSGTGWPSFWAPIDPDHVELAPDTSLIHQFLGARTEVRCSRCGGHLGHVFDDGPPPTGKRYCMNSLALHFIPQGEKPVRTFSED